MADGGITTRQAASVLRLSQRRVRELVKEGKLTAEKTPRGYRFDYREFKVESSQIDYARKLSQRGRKHILEAAAAIVQAELGPEPTIELLDGVKSVGVFGDARTIGHVLVIKFQGDPIAAYEKLGYDRVRRCSTRITNEVTYGRHHPIVHVTIDATPEGK